MKLGRTFWSVGTLLLILLLIGLSPLSQIWRVGSLFENLADRQIPVEEAAFEIEINVLGVGMSALGYARDRDPDHLARIEKDRKDIEEALAQIRRLNRDEEIRDIVDRLVPKLEEFFGLQEALVDTTAAVAEARRRVEQYGEEIRELIRAQSGESTAGGSDSALQIRERMIELETALNGVTRDFAHFMVHGESRGPGAIEASHEAVLRALAGLDGLGLSGAALDRIEAIRTRYGELHEAVSRTINATASERSYIERLIQSRRQIDEIIDEDLQAVLHRATEREKRSLESTTRQTLWIQLLLTLLGFGLALSLAGFLVGNEKEILRTQRKLRKANEAKSEFLANMSHEIRTPMNAVLGMVRLLGRTKLDERQEDYLDKVKRSSESLLRIINDILDFSRIEAGKLELEEVNFDLDEVMHDVAHMAGVQAEEKGLELVYRLQPDLPTQLRGDPLRLGQIMINLVNNAVKFTEQGQIVVAVRTIEDDGENVVLEVSVEDSGVGMSREEQDRLFKAFSQADTSTTRRFGGSGLGLSIVHYLVDRMGGEVSIDSTPGEGSRFTCTLHLARADASSDLTDAASRIPMKDRHALVVDDLEINREVLVEILRGWDFAVEEADSAEAALEKVESAADAGRPFSLILMDWKLPNMDGLDASKRILGNDPGDQPVVLMVTAYDREDLSERARAVGIPAVLKKPFTPSTLLNTITSVVDRSLSMREEGAGTTSAALPDFPGARILLVEDNSINVQVVRELLEYAGAEVRTAENGRAALKIIDSHGFDLVLMDAQMPELDGYEATRKLREDERYENLPIIAMTAHAMSGDRDKCLAAGMNDYIPKPIDEGQMFDTIARWLPASRVAWPERGDREVPRGSREGSASSGDPDSDTGRREEHRPGGGAQDEFAGRTQGEPGTLPGIDIARGLERVGGRRELLYRQLRILREKYADSPEEFRRILDTGRYTDGADLAHTIKGAAGMLGATGMEESAARLEALFRADDAKARTAEPEDCLEPFRNEVQTLCESVDTHLREDEGDEESDVDDSGEDWDREVVTRQVNELLQKLARNDLSSNRLLAELKEELKGNGYDAEIKDLEQSVDRLDFAAARDELETLAAQLDIEHG